MDKLIMLLLCLVTFTAGATVECRTTNTGTTYCTGTNQNGEQVNTESTTSNTGTTYVTGQEGGRNIHQECTTSITGTTYCN